MDPYKKSFHPKHNPTNFVPQEFNDDILEFNAFRSIIGMGLGRGYRLA
jgi:hypothetical protein